MKIKLLSLLVTISLIFTGCSKDDSTPEPKEKSTLKASSVANIDYNSTQQIIRGYGGANIIGWRNDLTSTQRVKAFSNWSGIGLSVLRVRISPNSSDWSANIPTMDVCRYYGGSIIASSWTAPSYMKTSNSTIGGKLKPEHYWGYAQHLTNFNDAVGGVMAISAWNEPDWVTSYECMNNTASEIANFISVRGANCGAEIMGPETLGMDQNFTTTVVNSAGPNLKYVCGHIYGHDPYYHNWGKEVWMTEHITDENDGNNWNSAMATALEIHDCMYSGYSMWVWWYIRRYYGLIDENSNITKRGYAVAQFARYIRPGYYKIACSPNPSTGIYTTAYKDGSKLVVVAINTNSSSTYQPFNINGTSVSGFYRIKTTSSSNLQSDSFSISGNNFGILLPASSITTLVSY